MNHLRILLLLFVVFGILLVFQSQRTNSENAKKENNTLTPSPHVSLTPTSSTAPTPTTVPTQIPTSSTSNTSLLYPGAVITENHGSTFILRSSDSSDAITDWYQDKLQNLGFSTKTFVKTKQNGNVRNILVVAKEKTNIAVEIKKNARDTITTIEIRSTST